jgi:hypothetical protein
MGRTWTHNRLAPEKMGIKYAKTNNSQAWLTFLYGPDRLSVSLPSLVSAPSIYGKGSPRWFSCQPRKVVWIELWRMERTSTTTLWWTYFITRSMGWAFISIHITSATPGQVMATIDKWLWQAAAQVMFDEWQINDNRYLRIISETVLSPCFAHFLQLPVGNPNCCYFKACCYR